MKTCCKFSIGKCAAAVNPQPQESFAIDRKRKDGRTPVCKSCLKKYRDDNKVQRQITIQAWRRANPEKMIGYRKGSASKNAERVRKWRAKNPDYKLGLDYGITRVQYNEMFEKQNGCCAICKRHQSEFSKALHVDHCHKSDKVRGLLCHQCNVALGLLKDDSTRLESAIAYLR